MSQDTARAWAWSVDAGWQQAGEASISIASPAILFGETLFESFRAHQGRWLAVPEHHSRLQASLRAWGWRSIPDLVELEALLRDGLSKVGGTEAYARLTCWPEGTGGGPGLLPAVPAGFALIVAQLNGGASMEGQAVSVSTAESIGRDSWALPYDLKHGNYLPSRWAMREARERGVEDVVLCRQDGSPVEASAANLLLFDGRTWHTPLLGRDGLNGVARARLVANGDIEESACSAEYLETAIAMALVNSVRGLRFIRSYDGRALEVSGVGVERLRTAWQKAVDGWLEASP